MNKTVLAISGLFLMAGLASGCKSQTKTADTAATTPTPVASEYAAPQDTAPSVPETLGTGSSGLGL